MSENELFLFTNNEDSEISFKTPLCEESDSDESSDLEEILESDYMPYDDLNSPRFDTSHALTEKVRLFIANLYKYPDIARKRADEVICEVSKLFEENLQSIKEEIRTRVKHFDKDSITVDEVYSILDKFSSPFQNFDTERKRFSHFKNCGTFVPPESNKLGEVKVIVEKEGEKKLIHKDLNVQFIPLRKVLKLFFELPEILEKTLQYMNKIKENIEIITNVIQCSLWKQKILNSSGTIRIPLVGYFDDYENSNPLGSHKGISKCGAVYINVALLPPEIHSKIDNIFLFMLFNSKHRVQFSNQIVYTRAIEELKYLKNEGIKVCIDNKDINIYFDFLLLTGDNLGLHAILGFVESFSANFFCRFCLTEHKCLHTVFNERNCVLRNITNYNNQLLEKNVARSGIKDTCIFNEIDDFHVLQNLSVDIQHDILEGILRYDLAIVLFHFICNAKRFSLDDLNLRLTGYKYGNYDNVNKPPHVSEKHLRNGCIILSAAEMLNFFRGLFLIVGPLVPEEDDHWQLLIELKTVVEIIFSKTIHESTHMLLDIEITEYLTELSKLYPNHMKPKHHFLIHYPRIMKSIGPLPQISCMRNESKHRDGKVTSHVAICRKNVCRTIAIKHQLMLNYRFSAKEEIFATFTSGPVKIVNFEDLDDVLNFHHLLPHYSVGMEVYLAKWIIRLGHKVKSNSIVTIFSENGPYFHVVKAILLSENNFQIITKTLHDCFLIEHLQAYKIFDNRNYSYAVLNLCDITYNTPLSVTNKLADGYCYIAKHWM